MKFDIVRGLRLKTRRIIPREFCRSADNIGERENLLVGGRRGREGAHFATLVLRRSREFIHP